MRSQISKRAKCQFGSGWGEFKMKNRPLFFGVCVAVIIIAGGLAALVRTQLSLELGTLLSVVIAVVGSSAGILTYDNMKEKI